MVTMLTDTELGRGVGDVFGSTVVKRVIADGDYIFGELTQAPTEEITADPAPANAQNYEATYAAAGPFTLPALASVNVGDKVTFTNVNGTAMTVTPAAGEILNDRADETYISNTKRQRVVVEKISATEWSASPNFVDSGTLSYAEFTVAVAGVGVDWALTEQTIRGSAVTTAGNTIVVAPGRRVKFTFDASRAEASGTNEFSYSFHDGTDHIGNSGTVMGHGVGATGASGIATASVEGPAVVTIQTTKLVGAVTFTSNNATNVTGAAMLTVEEYTPDTYQTGTMVAGPVRISSNEVVAGPGTINTFRDIADLSSPLEEDDEIQLTFDDASPATVRWRGGTSQQFRKPGTGNRYNLREQGGKLQFSSIDSSTSTLIGYVYRTKHTAIRAEDAPFDETSIAGVIDIGDTRIQRGEEIGGNPITFPAPFADTNYRITATATSGARIVRTDGKSTTGCSITQTVNDAGVSTSATFDWIAIGTKP